MLKSFNFLFLFFYFIFSFFIFVKIIFICPDEIGCWQTPIIQVIREHVYMIKEIYIWLLTADPISFFLYLYIAIIFSSCWLLFFSLSNSNVCYIFISLWLVVICATWVETCRLALFPPPFNMDERRWSCCIIFFSICKTK